jgi:hypothetical protein
MFFVHASTDITIFREGTIRNAPILTQHIVSATSRYFINLEMVFVRAVIAESV